MKTSLLACSLLFVLPCLRAQNRTDSVPSEQKKSVVLPAGKGRTIIDRSYNKQQPGFGTDRALKVPLPFKREAVPQPSPRDQKVFIEGVNTRGKVAEEEIDIWGFAPNPIHINKWYRDITGFRVFVDYGATVGFGKDHNTSLDLYSSFGYQFNPKVYLGVGQGFSMSINKEESFGPTFANLRLNLLDDHTTPYLDLKTGYSFIEGQGFYLNPNIGVSFGKNKHAWNIGAGYTFQRAKFKQDGVNVYRKYHGISLRVTFEFSIFK